MIFFSLFELNIYIYILYFDYKYKWKNILNIFYLIEKKKK